MDNKAKYQEAFKTFLAGIKIAWPIDPVLWQRVVLKPDFWQKIMHQLEEIAGWSKSDEIIVELIVEDFKQATAELPIDGQVKKLEELLRQGWNKAKQHAEIKHDVSQLANRLDKKT